MSATTASSSIAWSADPARSAVFRSPGSGTIGAPSPTPRTGRNLMRTFVLRARAAPVDSARLLAGVGKEAHTEILAHTLMNAIFVAQSHRADVVVYLVLESTPDFSRTIRFEADAMHDLGGFDERALLG